MVVSTAQSHGEASHVSEHTRSGLRTGSEVQDDQQLLAYARNLWSSDDYQAWRSHMKKDVADGLGNGEDHTPYA